MVKYVTSKLKTTKLTDSRHYMLTDNNQNDNSIKLLPAPKKRNSQPKLTSKQAKFIAAYLLTRDLKQSVIDSYPGCKNPSNVGYQLLRKSHIKLAVDKLLTRAEDKQLVSYEQIINKLLEHMQSSDKDVSIRAISEINKMRGFYAPTKTINLNLDLTIDSFEQLNINLKDF